MSDVLTKRERGVMWQHRILNVAWELKFGMSSSSLMLKLLELSGNDTAVIAQANSVHWAVNGFLQLFGTPLAGALSDSIGRKPLWALGRCSKLVWFMGSHRATSMNTYVVACILAWGVGDLGTLSVQEAAWADVFGDRPELSARLKASNQVWTGIAGLVGPIIGAQLSLQSATIGFFVSAAMCIIEAAMVMASRESLPKNERKPFVGIMPLLKKANPFSSIGLLFMNGPGLRALGISAGFLRAVRDHPSPCQAPFAPFVAAGTQAQLA
jgi:MFS family permease